MLFNGHNPADVLQAINLIQSLPGLFEVVDKRNITRSQRGYMHVCFGIVASELGVTLETVKQDYYKKLVNPDVYAVTIHDPVTDEFRITYRSSESLPKEVIKTTLDKFILWASNELGIVIPPPDNQEALTAALKHISEYEKTYEYPTT